MHRPKMQQTQTTSEESINPGKRAIGAAVLLSIGLVVAGCGSSDQRGERAAGGAAIGAGTGALVGLAFGGIGAIPGALIGGAVGGTTGAVTDEQDINLGDPIWR